MPFFDHLLPASDAFIVALMEGLPLATVISGVADGEVHLLNRKFVELFGYSQQDLCHVSDWWLRACPEPTYRQAVQAEWAVRIHQAESENGAIDPQEARVICKDGSSRIVRVELVKQGDVHVITFTDLTKHYQTEKALSFLASSGNSGEDFFLSLSRFLGETLEMNFVCIDDLEGDTANARTLAVWCDGHFEDNVRYALQDTPCGDVVGKEVCCFHAGVAASFPKDEVLQSLRAESYVGVTLWDHANTPIGLIAVIGRRPLQDPDFAASMLKLVAGRAAGELERRRVQATLLASEAMHRDLLERQGQGFGMVDAQERFLFVNPVAEEIFGVAPGHLLGRSLMDFLPSDQQDLVRRESVNRGQGVASTYELDIQREDGTLRTLLVTATPRSNSEGGELQVIGVFRDITDEKAAQGRLRESEEKFRNYVEQSIDVIFNLDAQGSFLFASPAWERHFGYPVSEILGKPFVPFIHPDDVAPCLDYLSRVLRTGQSETSPSYRVQHADGSWRWFVANGTSITTEVGPPQFLGVAHDITANKITEEALRASKQQYDELVASIPVGVYLIRSKPDQSIAFEYVSPRMADIFGLELDRLRADVQLAFEVVHPDDKDAFVKLNQDGLKSLAPFDWTGRIVVAGAVRWLHIESQPKILANGEVLWHGVVTDVTERKASEDAERESTELLSLFIRHSPIYTFIKRVSASESRVVQASDNFEQMVGIPASDMIGRTMAELFPAELADAITADDWAVVSDGKVLEVAEELNGRSYSTIKFPVSQGEHVLLAGFTIDITDRKRAERALMDSETRLRAIWDAEPECVKLVSPEGLLLDMNQAGLDMLEVDSKAQVIGKPVIGMVVPEHRARFQEIAEHAFREGSGFGEFEIVGLKGSRRWMETHVVPLRAEGSEATILLAVTRDINERKQGEIERIQLQAQLQQAQKMESLGSLAGGVAHDMNNVLGAILGLASAHIETQPQGSPVHRAFGTIIKAAERGGNMLKSLLSFARQNTTEVRELDLNAILREEVRLLERTTLAKVRLVMDLATDLRPIMGDAGALTHAFMNLSVNAVDAMPEKGTLTLRTRNLPDGWVEVQVEDTGMGMPKEVLEKALDPFFTTKEIGKGTGLGLSIVYSTVKAHHGQMELQSEPGCGTCVTLRFPASMAPAQPAEPSGAYRILAPRGSLNLLLVDDDELIQSSMQGILEHLGHQITIAPSGEEAIAKLTAGLRPDLVILDMNMPGLGGVGTLPRLRAMLPMVPVLLATGRADQVAQDLVKAHPFVTLLSKPFGMKELQTHLAPYIGG